MLHHPRVLRLLPLLAVACLTFLCSGCPLTPAAPGAPPTTALQTFDALYANAITAEDLILKGTTTSLQSGLINAGQAKQILAVTDAVKTSLDAARAAAQLGNTGTANADLAAALGPIAILSACLASRPLTPTTFNTCAAKLALPAVPT